MILIPIFSLFQWDSITQGSVKRNAGLQAFKAVQDEAAIRGAAGWLRQADAPGFIRPFFIVKTHAAIQPGATENRR
jgi:hypothetical protein